MYAHKACYQSPLGWIELSGNGQLSSVKFLDNQPQFFHPTVPAYLQNAVQELHEYFHLGRRQFDTPLNLEQGSLFQQSVWKALVNIPYAQTVSYLKIAQQIGDRKAVRAVGMAANKNPLPIFVPCHRVIGQDGSLIGFNLGLDAKRQLLALENPMSFGIQNSLF